MSIIDQVSKCRNTVAIGFEVESTFPQSFTMQSRGWYSFMFGDVHKVARTGPERAAAIVDKGITYNSDTGMLNIPNHPFNYQAGWFTTYSINEIAAAVEETPSWAPEAKMRVMFVKDYTDVGKQHYDANPGDFFQAASQLNALEMPSPNVMAEKGIQDYPFDGTQGPRCALACAPGTFVRNWFYNYPTDFNALENVIGTDGKALQPVNGYLTWGDKPESVYDALSTSYGEIKISSQLYTQVCGPLIKGGNTIFPQYSNKLVHQVYSSSAPINTYGNSGDVAYQNAVAASLQQAAYYGTLGMATIVAGTEASIKKDYRHVNLTLVGTGVFNNEVSGCMDVLISVLKMFQNYPLWIRINTFSDSEKLQSLMREKWAEAPLIREDFMQ
jgi:hypothetical protein